MFTISMGFGENIAGSLMSFLNEIFEWKFQKIFDHKTSKRAFNEGSNRDYVKLRHYEFSNVL